MEPQAPIKSEFAAVSSLQLHEAWEVLNILKLMAEEDKGVKLRSLLEAYPALIPALQQIQVCICISPQLMLDFRLNKRLFDTLLSFFVFLRNGWAW